MKRTMIAICLLAAAFCQGCDERKERMTLPDGFVEVGPDARGRYHTRAISPDGVVVALRIERNAENAGADFWGQAIRNELAQSRGYALTAKKEIQSAAGLEGRMMEFSTDADGETGVYMVAVFVSGDEVLVSEAGGKTGAVAPLADSLRTAMLGVR